MLAFAKLFIKSPLLQCSCINLLQKCIYKLKMNFETSNLSVFYVAFLSLHCNKVMKFIACLKTQEQSSKPSKGFVIKSRDRESQREPERFREKEPERARESPREPKRQKSQREAERLVEAIIESDQPQMFSFI